MDLDFLKKLAWFVVLILLQVFVLNHVHLFGIATPLLYIYFISHFSKKYPQWGSMTWAFLMGLLIDTLSNTPGVSAFSLTFLSALQPFVLKLFLSRENTEDVQPGLDTLSFGQYFWYIALLTLLYCMVFFTLDMFSFFNILEWGTYVLSSSLLTIVLILVVENVRRR